MIVWKTNLSRETKHCGNCRVLIRPDDDYAEILLNADERIRQRALIRCAACGARMEEEAAAAREATRLLNEKEAADEREDP